MIVRPEAPPDYDSIRELVTVAFGDANVAQLVELIRATERYVPELALVAEDESVLVGHIMLSYAVLSNQKASTPVLLLSPLAVTPARQRQGIGGALVRTVLALADGRGEPLVVVEGIPTYYPRFGFERARDHGIEPRSPHIADAAFMVRRLSRYRDDLGGRVVYPPAFDVVAQ